MRWPQPKYALFPYTTLFRSFEGSPKAFQCASATTERGKELQRELGGSGAYVDTVVEHVASKHLRRHETGKKRDRKSTRLNSSHVAISYAVFCLKKKRKHRPT